MRHKRFFGWERAGRKYDLPARREEDHSGVANMLLSTVIYHPVTSVDVLKAIFKNERKAFIITKSDIFMYFSIK